MNRFLLLGEHTLLLESLAALLRTSFDADVRVQRFETAAALNGWRPTLAIVDSPDVPGSAARVRTALAPFPEARLLVIGPNEHEHLIAALKLGARGFLPRDCTTEQLLNCVNAVLRDELALPRGMVGPLIESYVALLRNGGEGAVPLSGREPRILDLLAQGLTTAEIAARLYVSEGTIRTDIRLLLQKFGVSSRAQLLAEAFRRDLIARP